MKVDITTIIDNINFGTILQAYALASVIKEMGHTSEIIDYWRPNSTTVYQVKGILYNSKRSFLNRIIYGTSAMILVPYIKHKLRSFVKKDFKFTPKISSKADILKKSISADVFVTGSDQVWNSVYNEGIDDIYYLDFTDKKKVSYASSIGLDSFPDYEITKVVQLLSKYSFISLRENKSCEYIERLGFQKPFHAIDPTMLLSKEQWLSHIKEKHNLKDDFLLVYSVEGANNDFIFQQARRVAEQKKLKMYAITPSDPFKLRKYACDKIFSFADCESFLELMSKASFIVASSFHGTAFAVNFKKDFITITPDKYNIRMEDLMTKFGLHERIVNFENPISDTYESIDYDRIHRILKEWKTDSLNYLSKALS